MSLVPDMFQYEGALDLTEYYVRNTELRADTSDLVRVEVNVNILYAETEIVKISVVNSCLFTVCDTEETIEPNSHDIPADHFYDNHRAHVQLL